MLKNNNFMYGEFEQATIKSPNSMYDINFYL